MCAAVDDVHQRLSTAMQQRDELAAMVQQLVAAVAEQSAASRRREAAARADADVANKRVALLERRLEMLSVACMHRATHRCRSCLLFVGSPTSFPLFRRRVFLVASHACAVVCAIRAARCTRWVVKTRATRSCRTRSGCS
jgi:hypothetical protein